MNWHQKDMCSSESRLRAQNIFIILSSIVNMIGGGGPIWPLNEHEDPHFDNE